MKPPLRSRGGVTSRARTREDRAGDPLDGLVNLFDLGIVLSVAFLLAALSSLKLESAVFSSDGGKVPEDTVVAKPNEDVRSIKLNSGERVVGRGEPVGTVYRLTDGRTIIVQGKKGKGGASGTGGTTPGTGSATPGTGFSTPGAGSATPGTGGTSTDVLPGTTVPPPADQTPGQSTDDEPTLGAPDTGANTVP